MRLDQIVEPEIVLHCEACRAQRAVPVALLLERFGRAAILSDLLAQASCPRCGANEARWLELDVHATN